PAELPLAAGGQGAGDERFAGAGRFRGGLRRRGGGACGPSGDEQPGGEKTRRQEADWLLHGDVVHSSHWIGMTVLRARFTWRFVVGRYALSGAWPWSMTQRSTPHAAAPIGPAVSTNDEPL